MSLLRLPRQMKDVQTLLRSLDWHAAEQEVAQEMASRLVIVGPVNSGKSTLFNRLHGRKLSATSAVPGTTTGVVEHPLGPFLLVDTPGFGEVWGGDHASVAQQAEAQADLVLLILDAVAGVRQTDLDLYQKLLGLKVPVIVALNKTDAVRGDLPVGDARYPDLCTEWRWHSQWHHPRDSECGSGRRCGDGESVARSADDDHPSHYPQHGVDERADLAGAHPGSLPLLLASQTRLVLRIAAVYGHSLTVSHARELLTTMAGSLFTRYLGLQLAKLVPGLGWLASAALSAAATWGMGHAARRYFEAGATMRPPNLRELYQRMRRAAPKHLFRWKAAP